MKVFYDGIFFVFWLHDVLLIDYLCIGNFQSISFAEGGAEYLRDLAKYFLMFVHLEHKYAFDFNLQTQ